MTDRTASRIRLALSLLYCGIAVAFAVTALVHGRPGLLLGVGVWTGLALAIAPRDED